MSTRAPDFGGGVRRLPDGSYWPLVKIDGGFVSPPPGEPKLKDIQQAADRSRELGGVTPAERRRVYWATPIVCE